MHGVSDRGENEQGFDATCQFDVTKRGKELNDPSRTNPRLGRADPGAYIDRALPSVTMRCYDPPPVVLRRARKMADLLDFSTARSPPVGDAIPCRISRWAKTSLVPCEPVTKTPAFLHPSSTPEPARSTGLHRAWRRGTVGRVGNIARSGMSRVSTIWMIAS